MSVTAADVKKLREMTGAGMMDCKKALVESNGDFDKAKEFLRKKGLAKADKKGFRSAKEGIIYSYVHFNNKMGSMIELNCETDFVARTDEFKALAKDICMQIAAMKPEYLDKESVPQDMVEREKEIYRDQVKNKPENVQEKIIEGKLSKFYEEKCLLNQKFFKDDSLTIEAHIKNYIAKLGENIRISRFSRFGIGE
jgi:elongation factor Ts